MAYTAGVDREAGYIVPESVWNAYLGAGGSLDTLKAWQDAAYSASEVDALIAAIEGGANVADCKEAIYINVAPVNDTWYAALNIAAGAGYLDEIIIMAEQNAHAGEWRGFGCRGRVNVDGRGNFDFDGSTGGSSEDSFSSLQVLFDGAVPITAVRIIFGGARFAASLVVSVSAADISAGGALRALVHYREE
ncbi:MAG: hypothetical protein ABIG68_05210 [Acidobacteriota bacterium]